MRRAWRDGMLLLLLVASCGDDGPPASASGSTGPDPSTTDTSSVDSTTELDPSTTAVDGTSGGPMVGPCDETVTRPDDPLVLIGSSEPDVRGLVSLAATSTHVLGCAHDGGLTVWSVADPTAPSVEATGLSAGAGAARCDHVALDLEDPSRLVTVRRPVDGDGGVTIWDLDDPSTPAVLAHFATMLPVEGATLDGVRVMVAAGPQGLVRLSFDGVDLVEQGTFVDADSDARGLALQGDTLWVAEGRAGLRAYDVAPDVPVLLGAAGLGAVALDVQLDGSLAYAATLEAVAVVDISDAGAPALLAQVPTPGAALDLSLALAGELVVVADWDEVRGISIADPMVPQLHLGEPAAGSHSLDRMRAVAMSGDRVVASAWRGLHVYQLAADAEAPELEVESLRVDFRTDAAGQVDDHVVVLRNTGSAPLSICGIESTLAGLDIEITQAVIEAQSTLPVEIIWTDPDHAPAQGQLTIHSNDPDEPLWEVPLRANTPRVDVGDPAIEFHYVDTEGRSWSSEALAGQVWLLAYFASWCPTCNTEFPGYETELHQLYADQGLAVVGLGNETIGKILAFQGTTGASFPLLVSERSYREWEDPPRGSYSLQVVVGRDGVVREIGNELTAAQLEPLIVELLAR